MTLQRVTLDGWRSIVRAERMACMYVLVGHAGPVAGRDADGSFMVAGYVWTCARCGSVGDPGSDVSELGRRIVTHVDGCTVRP